MEGVVLFFIFISIVAAVLQAIITYLFVRTANDIHFLKKEYEKIKRIHKLAEYSLIKGDHIYAPGDIFYCPKVGSNVRIESINDDGTYTCIFYARDNDVFTERYLNIGGDELQEARNLKNSDEQTIQ